MAINIKPSHKGKLHEKLGVSKDKPISTKKLEAAKNSSSPAERKEANFALNARKWNHSGGGGAAKELTKRLGARDKK